MSDDERETSDREQPQLKLDKKAEQGFISFFKSLEDTSDEIRFFDRKGYYSVHGRDAMNIASWYYKTTACVKQLGSGSQTLASVTVSQTMFANILRDLFFSRNCKVQLWGPAGGNKWVPIKYGSPGNVTAFEDVLFTHSEMSDAPVVMALRLSSNAGERVIGLAFADATQRVIGLGEFTDTDQFVNLEAAAVQVGAKECVLAAAPGGTGATAAAAAAADAVRAPDDHAMRSILERCNIVLTDRKRTDFTSKDARADLARLTRSVHAAEDLSALPNAVGAAAALIKYLDLLSDASNHGSFRLVRFDLARYMRLDAAAVRALNLVPAPGDMNKRFSLSGLLDQCRTAMGSRLLRVWLRQPLLDRAQIEERQNVVEALVNDSLLRQSIFEEHLKRIPDISRLAKKFLQRRARLQDIVVIYQVVLRLPRLHECLAAYTGPHADLLHAKFTKPLEQVIADCKQLQAMVEATIDLDLLEQHEYAINPQFDPELQALRDQQDAVRAEMSDLHPKVAADLGLDLGKLKLESNRQLGYFFRVSRKDEQCMRGRKEYAQIDTRKDGVRFVNAKLRDLSARFSSLREEYEQKQGALEGRAVEIVSTYVPVMEDLNRVLAELDVLLSFAHVSVTAPTPYVRPTITPAGQGDIVLENARHPCMEALDDVQFIANDVRLLRDKSRFAIITGPNMGGKSTYIRMAGVLVLLAQIGCFVPASRATVSIVDCVLARVGAGDALLRGVSTFMAEMLETAAVLRAATPASLIIIDELGRGTSTYDGFGLAWAISEHISTKIGCWCLFATHFHELTALAKHVPAVVNLHVTAHTGESSLTLLYRVEDGPCDQSFGIHVAELARFPPEVVLEAKRKADELEGGQGSTTDFEPPQIKKLKDERAAAGAVRRALRLFADVPADASAPAAVLAQTRSLLLQLAQSEPALRPLLPAELVSAADGLQA